MKSKFLTLLVFACGLAAVFAQSRHVRFLAVGDSPPFRQEIRDNIRREIEPEAGSIPPREIVVGKTSVALALNRISDTVEIPGGEGGLSLKDKTAAEDAEAWVNVARPESGDFLVLLWRSVKSATWDKARAFPIADDATSAPAGSARIINLAPENVSVVLGIEKLSLLPGKLLTQVIPPGHPLPLQVYFPDKSGRLKRISSTELACETGQRVLVVIYRADGETPRQPVKVVIRREPVVVLAAAKSD